MRTYGAIGTINATVVIKKISYQAQSDGLLGVKFSSYILLELSTKSLD